MASGSSSGRATCVAEAQEPAAPLPGVGQSTSLVQRLLQRLGGREGKLSGGGDLDGRAR